MLLQLAFFEGSVKDRSDWKMNFYKRFSGKYVHVALIFDDSGIYYTSESKYGCSVSWTRTKEFKRDGWIMKPISVSQTEYTLIKNYCKNAYQRKAGYNYRGQILCLTPFPDLGSGNEDTYTCSELVVCAFHAAKLFLDLVPEATTPHDIMHAISGYDVTVQVPPISLKGKRLSATNINYDSVVSTTTTNPQEDVRKELTKLYLNYV